MRKTLNRKLIEANRVTHRGDLPKEIDLEWQAYLQLHHEAADRGLLGRDAPLHDFLDERLAHFEECAWIDTEKESYKLCPKCGSIFTGYTSTKRCPQCRVALVERETPT